MVEKWGDVAHQQRGCDVNGGVSGHESRWRATTAEEDINDEVGRDWGACREGWAETWQGLWWPPSSGDTVEKC